MPWTRPTLTQIVTRVESDITSRLTGGAALLRRSMLAILARVFAGGMHILHGYFEFISFQLFIDTAETNYLDRHAVIWGVPRNAAAFATGTLTIIGVDGTPIPSGTQFVRDDGTEYSTNSLATIASGTAILTVTCITAGESGNANTGLIFTIGTPILNISDSATVLSPGISGGTDQETDDALRVRITARIQNPPAGGSAVDYIAWAKSISGIGQAWVKANYYGLGTVAVVIRTNDPTSLVPSGPLITQVQNYIDTVRPVTAAVTVAAIIPVSFDIQISMKPNTSELRSAVLISLTEMFSDDAVPAGTILISHVYEAILTSGLQDFTIDTFTVGGTPTAVGNVTLSGFQYPVLGVLTINTLA